MASPFEIQVSGRLPLALSAAILIRFGPVDLVEQPGRTALLGCIADQAALRALLCLIWDVGGSVVSVVVGPSGVP
jgi:hypothetical protein